MKNTANNAVIAPAPTRSAGDLNPAASSRSSVFASRNSDRTRSCTSATMFFIRSENDKSFVAIWNSVGGGSSHIPHRLVENPSAPFYTDAGQDTCAAKLGASAKVGPA